jgi:hypothetical protein
MFQQSYKYSFDSRSRSKIAALLICAATLLTACDGGSGGVNQSLTAPTPTPTPPPPKFACPAPAPATKPLGSFDLASIPVLSGSVDLQTAPASPVSFSQIDLLSGMNYSYGFAAADFDCDGKIDVSFFDSYTGRSPDRPTPSSVGYVSWNSGPLEAIATDELTEVTHQYNEGLVLIERQIGLDVNADGFTDIVAVANSHHSVVAYLNPGYRATPWQRIYLSEDTPGAVNLTSGDIDKDGLKDVIVAMRDQPSSDPNPDIRGVVWLKNPGKAGEAWVQQAIGPTDDLIDTRNLQVADFNADGNLDVAVSDSSNGNVAILSGDGGKQWTREDINPLALHAHFGVTADFDNDKRAELFQPTYQGVTLLRNTGTWSATRLATFASEPTQYIVSQVDVGDLDLDGKADIVFSLSSPGNSFTNARRGGVYWMRPDGTSWKIFEIQRTTSAVQSIELVDYDKDGDLDIITNLEYPANSMYILVNSTK